MWDYVGEDWLVGSRFKSSEIDLCLPSTTQALGKGLFTVDSTGEGEHWGTPCTNWAHRNKVEAQILNVENLQTFLLLGFLNAESQKYVL